MTTRLLMLAALALAGCSHTAPDATPEGAVRAWVEAMESSAEDPSAMRDAYALLGPHARANLAARAERASRGQGRRYAPYEMLAVGRFGLKFRPRAMTAHVDGARATVEVSGEGPEEHASVSCAREPGGWRIEPELPDVPPPAHREEGGG